MIKLSTLIKEAKKPISIADIVKILRSSDFGYTAAGGSGDVSSKGNTLIIKTSFFYGAHRALQSLKNDWSGNGFMAKYFRDTHNVDFDIVREKTELAGGTMYGKKAKDGVVTIELQIK